MHAKVSKSTDWTQTLVICHGVGLSQYSTASSSCCEQSRHPPSPASSRLSAVWQHRSRCTASGRGCTDVAQLLPPTPTPGSAARMSVASLTLADLTFPHDHRQRQHQPPNISQCSCPSACLGTLHGHPASPCTSGPALDATWATCLQPRCLDPEPTSWPHTAHTIFICGRSWHTIHGNLWESGRTVAGPAQLWSQGRCQAWTPRRP